MEHRKEKRTEQEDFNITLRSDLSMRNLTNPRANIERLIYRFLIIKLYK